MKFTVARDVLAEAVNWTARTVPTRPSVPILAGIRMTAQDGTLALSSFDYEISTRSEVEADIAQDGEVLVSGRLLASITKALPNQPVECSLEGAKLNVICGTSHFTLASMSVDEYPLLPQIPRIRGSVDAQVLAQAISQVSVAASSDDTIPLLTGVRMEIEDDKITLLGTDRYRLAMREFSWEPEEPGISTALLVKARTLGDVAKSMTSAGRVEIAFDADIESQPNSLIGFAAGNRRTTSTLMDGDYPPVRRLFPEETSIQAVVDRYELLDAVKRVSLVAEQKTSVRLGFADERLVLEAGQDDNAQASEVVGAKQSGGDIQTAFNPRYLESGLSVLDTDYVRFSFTDPAKPAVITGQKEETGGEDLRFRYLIMPIRFGI
ncbi:MAG: DNA polymerase III subunit beta [Actinomycetaceae bacterium]|nr:DNA polymerase III subunit beta [Actinomycetaceae bacterium]